MSQPHPAQLAHVAVPEFAALHEGEDQAVVPVPLRLVLRPDQVAAHAEVEQERRPSGPAHQPLAVAARILEAPADQGTGQRAGLDVAEDRGISFEAGDGPACRVQTKDLAEVLDVGELGHRVSL